MEMADNLELKPDEKYLALKERESNKAKQIDYIPEEYQTIIFSFLRNPSFSDIIENFRWSYISFIAIIVCLPFDILGIFSKNDVFNPTILFLVLFVFIFIAEKSSFNTKKRKDSLYEFRLDGNKNIEQRFLREITENNLQSISIPNLILNENEKAYWSESAIFEEQACAVDDNKSVPVSYGEVIVTNMRIIYMGNKRSFAVDLENIAIIHFFDDKVQFSEINNTTIKYLKLELNSNIIRIVLNYFLKPLSDG
jgi:hypothetical protein